MIIQKQKTLQQKCTKKSMLDVYTKKIRFEIIKEEENYNDTGQSFANQKPHKFKISPNNFFFLEIF